MAIQRDDAYPVTPGLEQHIADTLQVWVAKITAGICPQCGHHMTRRQQGTDVYAWPCNHRLYQGSAECIPK